MKLGTQTASLNNHLMSRAVIGQPKPVVGMGATILCWTDRHGATITKVDGRYITVQEDAATRTDSNGMSESQDWAFRPNTNGREHVFFLTTSQRWQAVAKNESTGRYRKVEGSGLRIGERSEYYDFSF